MLTGVNLLIIEDDANSIKTLTMVLESLHAKVDYAYSAAEGMRLLGINHYDAILLDLFLPDSKGPTTISKFQEVFPNVPIIVSSGMAFPDLEREALRLGAQEILIKCRDITAEDFSTAITHAVERHKVRKIFEPIAKILDKASECVSEMQKLSPPQNLS